MVTGLGGGMSRLASKMVSILTFVASADMLGLCVFYKPHRFSHICLIVKPHIFL
jgi:hypothetical protein